MASARKRENGTWLIRFGKRVKGKDLRKTVTFTDLSKRESTVATRRVEELFQCVSLDLPIGHKTREWLDSLSDEQHQRLVDKGLCEAREQVENRTVVGMCKHFLAWKAEDNTDSSTDVYQRTTRMLTHYFGPSLSITDIRPAQIDDFLKWIKTHGKLVNGKYGYPLAATTAASRCRTVKSIFRRAARQRWIDSVVFMDMFDDSAKHMKARVNMERQHWVDADTVRTVLDHATNNEQRLIFALGRWGGIRMPSELLGIKWVDVDRETEKLRIHSPKQRNTTHRQVRWIPIWPEIRPYLDNAYDEAEAGEQYVIARYRSSNTSAHSSLFKRAAYRAGIIKNRDKSPWPKLWNNQRSTRVTELRKQYPADVVNYWMNHSEEISQSTYQQWSTYDWRA